MILFLTLMFLISVQIEHVTCSRDRLKALKFSNNGYIMWNSPDMSPFTNKLTVCSWLRDQSSSSHPTVFNYGPINRIRLAATGFYNCIAEQCNLNVRNELAAIITKGTWFHACLSWSTSSRALRYYANGQLLGTMTTDSRTLSTGYKVVLGNHAKVLDSQYAFTGEMSNLNVYSKELTSEEIRRQAEAGMCSLNLDENEDYRVLKWENLIKLPKTGSVTEELPTSCLTKLEETQRTLEETRGQLNSTLKEKERIAVRLLKTEENLNSTQLELEKVTSNLNTTTAELQVALDQIKDCNKTRWDWELFTQSDFFNKTVSEEVAQQLNSSWDNIAGNNLNFGLWESSVASGWCISNLAAEFNTWHSLTEQFIGAQTACKLLYS